MNTKILIYIIRNPKIRIPVIGALLFILVCLGTSLMSPYFYAPATVVVNPSSVVLGSTDYGDVIKEGPYGNASSPVKIAFIVGVHPWEVYAHKMAINSIKIHTKSLKYCYYIYQVNVTNGVDSDYETGRMDGQQLAYNYAVPDIEKQNFQLAIDVHSNKGALDYYDVGWFLNVPVEDAQTSRLAYQIQSKIPGIVFYNPPDPTSPYYVTVPLIKSGTPAIIYEAYAYDDPQIGQSKMDKLLYAVDSLHLSLKYPVEKLA